MATQQEQWYPRLTGKAGPEVDQAFRIAFDGIYHLRDELRSLPPPPVVPTLEQIKKALEVGGSNPLYLVGLPGRLSESQTPYLQEVTSLPSPGDPLAREGTLVYYNHIIYRFDEETQTWVPVTGVLQDTHANRLANYPASGYADGGLFFETDRQVLYVARKDGLGVAHWYYVSGVYMTEWATRNLELADGDQGMLYYASDRHVLYKVIDAEGFVDTSGNNVAYFNGQHFYTDWPANSAVTINNVAYSIANVANATAMTINQNAGTQSNVAYKVIAGAWQYLEGTLVGSHVGRNTVAYSKADDGALYHSNDWDKKALWRGNWSDLSGFGWDFVSGWWTGNLGDMSFVPANASGMLYYCSEYEHLYQKGSNGAWAFAPGDPGSKYIVATTGAAPSGGLWGLCDGSTYTCATTGALTSNVATPNLIGNVFVMGGSYTGNVSNATSATWNSTAKTDNNGDHTHSVDASEVASGGAMGNGYDYAPGTSGNTAAAYAHYHNVDPASATSSSNGAHTHNLSDGNAILNPPSETDGGLPIRIALTWYLRR